MSEIETVKEVDQYILKKEQWAQELDLLRQVLIGSGMNETLKWGTPVYVAHGKNVVGLAAFKNYVGIWFFHGALLEDKSKVLFNAQEEKLAAMRQWRFTDFDEIVNQIELIEAYVKESISNTEKGIFVKPKKNKPLVIPLELEEAFKRTPELKKKYYALNLTKKREFARYIDSAKRSETRRARLEKMIPLVFEGVGLNDKHRK